MMVNMCIAYLSFSLRRKEHYKVLLNSKGWIVRQ